MHSKALNLYLLLIAVISVLSYNVLSNLLNYLAGFFILIASLFNSILEPFQIVSFRKENCPTILENFISRDVFHQSLISQNIQI